MADRFWPGGDALGRKIRMPRLGTGQWIVAAPASTDWLEIVGIVGNVANRGLHEHRLPLRTSLYTLWIADNLGLIVGPGPLRSPSSAPSGNRSTRRCPANRSDRP